MNARLITIIPLLSAGILFAQPGAHGGYDMSFTIIDTASMTSDYFSVYPTYYSYSEGRNEIADTFKYDIRTNRFYYTFESTPAGPAIPMQFTINAVSGVDTMKIYYAHTFIEDTLYFIKGEFIATMRYLNSRSIDTFNSTTIKNDRIDDYRLSRLPDLPYYSIGEGEHLKSYESYSIFNSKELPNKDILSYGIIGQRVVKGNAFSKGESGSYSSVNNTSFIDDNGIAFFLKSNPEQLRFNYKYEMLDTLLAGVNTGFSIRTGILRKYMPNGLRWNDINSITFAILANLQVINDSLWAITLNQNKVEKKIYISKNKGLTWGKSLSVRSDLALNLRSFKKDLYAYVGNEIYRSKDLGKSWSHSMLQIDSMNIIELAIVDDTTGFLLCERDRAAALIKFNPQTRKATKLLGLINWYPSFQKNLRQRASSLFYHNNTLVLKTGDEFLVSADLGLTWHVIANECIMILKEPVIWSWHKGIVKKETQDEVNTGYFPMYYRCGELYHFKSLLQTRDGDLLALCYYDQAIAGGNPTMFVGSLKFHGFWLNEGRKK